MDQDQDATAERDANSWTDVAIRLTLVALIVYWSFLLMRPFIAILIWAAILSVTLYPAKAPLCETKSNNGTPIY